MKTLRLFVLLASLLFAGVAAPPSARAEAAVSFDFFYDSLAPYGDWVQVGDYGLCWRPNGVDSDWTPYSDGYWAYTDAGWTWVSYEEFGGIVYHYGRWIRLDDDSWCWAPDYEWGPAWVSWRSSDDYVGWAPLPPEARWRRDVGISVWVDRECDLGPGYYSFCRTRDFGAPVLRGVLLNRRENVTIIRTTVNVTNITYNTGYAGGPVIFNGGPSFVAINRVSARPVPALKLVQEADFDPARHRGPNGRVSFHAQTVGNQLIVAAPRVLRPSDPGEFRSRAKRVFAGDSVTRGWNGVKSPEMQKELRQEMGRQAKGLTPQTAPARAVAAADLKAVPTKADPNATPPTMNNERRERPDRPGRNPENVATQPNRTLPTNNTPPNTSATATPFAKPTAPATTTTPGNLPGEPNGVAREREHNRDRSDRNPPGAPPVSGNSNLKPFNQTPDTRSTQTPPTGPATAPRGANTDDGPARDRAAEQARTRGEQQQRMEQQQQQQRLDQQRQSENAARQKQQADAAAEQQKQISAQQEAARARADEQRRREASDQRQQQQQMQNQQQQQQQLRQQQPQEQQQRAQDARRGQEADRAARERAREQSENQRPQPMRPQQPQSQPQQPPNNQSGNPSQRGGGNGGQHSKGGNDKDKDKDRN